MDQLTTGSEKLEFQATGPSRGVVTYRAEASEVASLLRMFRSLRRIYDGELRALNAILARRGPASDEVVSKLRGGLSLITDAELRERVKDVGRALAQMSRTMEAILAQHDKQVAALEDAQIKAVMRAEFLRAAHTFTDEEWRVLDEVRAVQASAGQRAAFIAGRNGLRAIGQPISRAPGLVPEVPDEPDEDMEDDDA